MSVFPKSHFVTDRY